MRQTLPLVGELASRSFTKLLSIMSRRKAAVRSMSVMVVLAVGFSTAEAQWPFGDYLTSPPADDSTDFFGSGQFVCEFDRRDRPELVDVKINVGVGPQVTLSGTAVCGLTSVPRLPSGHLRDFVFVLTNVTWTCPTIASDLSQITQRIGDCPTVGSVTGTFTAVETFELPAVGTETKAALVTACGQVSGCVINVGFPAGIPDSILEKKVCGPNGVTLAFALNADSERPEKFEACYCNSHFASDPGGPIECPKVGNTYTPQTVATSGAVKGDLAYGKSGSGADVLNASGHPSTINALITGSDTCPVDDIATSTVRVCDGVRPRNFKLQTLGGGQRVLSFQFSEGDCRDTLAALVVGSSRDIFVAGEFKDGTLFEGVDDVLVQ